MDAFSLVATLELEAESFFSGLSSAAEAMIEFAASCVETSAEYDTSMSKVEAVTYATTKVSDKELNTLIATAQRMGYTFKEGADNTATAMNILRSATTQMAADSVFTAKEMADMMYYMGLAGWSAEDMLKGAPGIAALAAASFTDLGKASDIVTDGLTAMRMEASDAKFFADVLATTSAMTNTDVIKMGESFKYVANQAGMYGYSLEDVAESLGIMANGSIKASTAGRALANVMKRMLDDTSDSRTLLESLGVHVYNQDYTNKEWQEYYDYISNPGYDGKVADFLYNQAYRTGTYRDWSDLVDDMRQMWGTLTDVEKSEYSKQIAGATGAKGFAALMNASESKIQEFRAALAQCWYTMDSLNAAIEAGGGNMESMRSAMSNLGITTKDFDNALTNSHGNAKKFVEALARLAGNGKTSDDILKALGITIDDLQQAFDSTSGAAQKMSEILRNNLNGDISKFNSVLDVLKKAIGDRLVPTLREYVQLGTEGLKDVYKAFTEGGWKEGAEAFSNWLGKASDKLHEDLPKWREAGTEFISALSDGLQKASPVIGEAIGFVGDMIGQFLSENAATITSTVTTIITSLTPGVIAAIRGIADGLKEAWPDVRLALGEMLEELGVFNEGFLSGLVPDWLQNLLNFLHIDLRGELDNETGNLRDYFLQAPPHGTNTDRAQPAGTYNEEFVPRETLETGYVNTGDRSFDEALREAEQQAEPTNTNEQIADWLHDNAEQGGVVGALFGAAESLWTGATGAQNRDYRETEALIGNMRDQQVERFTVESSFVDGISGPSGEAAQSLVVLGNLVKDNYESFSLHDDQTSEAAGNAIDAVLRLLGYDNITAFTASYHNDGSSGPIADALMSLLEIMGWNGTTFETDSEHTDNASGVMEAIMALLDALLGRDGQHTETSSTHTQTTIDNIIHRERWESPQERNEALGVEITPYATAMHGGRILRRATVFGQDQFGRPLVGGETGPEAVVGVNSLYQMIGEAVGRAMAGVIGQLNGTGRQPNYQIVLDSGVLVGELVSPMDGALDRRAAWRGGGRA